jgi:hypothetical protein
VVAPLNAAARAAAARHGWRFVDSLAAAFATHGYCAREPWVVQVGQSRDRQDDNKGAFHPNRLGHDIYGRALSGAAGALLPVVDGGSVDEPQDGIDDPMEALQRSDVHLVYLDGSAVRAVPVVDADEESPLLPVDLSFEEELDSGWVRVVATPNGLAATWMENTDPRGYPGGFEVFSAKLYTAPPDIEVLGVRAVQATRDATTLAAGKQAAVELTLNSTFSSTQRTSVQIEGPAGPVTLPVAVPPGRKVMHLSTRASSRPPAPSTSL